VRGKRAPPYALHALQRSVTGFASAGFRLLLVSITNKILAHLKASPASQVPDFSFGSFSACVFLHLRGSVPAHSPGATTFIDDCSHRYNRLLTFSRFFSFSFNP